MKFILSLVLALFISVLSAQVTIRHNFPTAVKGGSTVDMEIKIDKMGVANFAKYQMDVPSGVNVFEVDSRTGTFTFENNRAKIVWVSIPTEAELVVKFRVNIPASLQSPAYLTQKFFYLDNGSKKEVDAEAVTFSVSETAVAANSTPKKNEPVSIHNTNKKNSNHLDTVTGVTKAEPKKENPKTEVTKTETKKETPKTEVAKTETKKETPKTETPKTEVAKTETPKTETKPMPAGTIYRIQLGAGASDPGKAKYASVGDVDISKEGGMFKVLTGNCATKEEALKLREQLIAKGFTGFVVAYNNGVRVK